MPDALVATCRKASRLKPPPTRERNGIHGVEGKLLARAPQEGHSCPMLYHNVPKSIAAEPAWLQTTPSQRDAERPLIGVGEWQLARHCPICRPRRRAGRLPGLPLNEVTTMMKNPPHPGELLREDVLVPLGIEITDAAQRLGMSRTTLSRVINGHAGISPDLALRLERAGVSTARFWMNLQANYELAQAAQRKQPKVRPLQDAA